MTYRVVLNAVHARVRGCILACRQAKLVLKVTVATECGWKYFCAEKTEISHTDVRDDTFVEVRGEVNHWDYFCSSGLTLFLETCLSLPRRWRWQQRRLLLLRTLLMYGEVYSRISFVSGQINVSGWSKHYSLTFQSRLDTDSCLLATKFS